MPSNLSFKKHVTTGQFYTQIHSEIFERALTTKPPTVEEFLNWLNANVKTPELLSALDAGCGAHALNTRSCLEYGFRKVEAIDINPDAIRLNSDISVTQGSVLDIPFPDASFDFVICSGVIHHTPVPETVIRELGRVLVRGGQAYISIYAFRHSLFHIIVIGLRVLARVLPFRSVHRIFGSIPAANNFFLDHAYVPILWLFRNHEIKSLLMKYGFEIENDFPTSFDKFSNGFFGKLLTGGGLMRIYVCRKK